MIYILQWKFEISFSGNSKGLSEHSSRSVCLVSCLRTDAVAEGVEAWWCRLRAKVGIARGSSGSPDCTPRAARFLLPQQQSRTSRHPEDRLRSQEAAGASSVKLCPLSLTLVEVPAQRFSYWERAETLMFSLGWRRDPLCLLGRTESTCLLTQLSAALWEQTDAVPGIFILI